MVRVAQIKKEEFERLQHAEWGASAISQQARKSWERVPRALWIAIGVCTVAVVLLGLWLVGGRAGDDFVARSSSAEVEMASGESGFSEATDVPVVSETPVVGLEGKEPPPLIYVHVAGAVGAPGVYGLPEGARVHEAIEEAGGLAVGADVTTVNLAAPVADGNKIAVPWEGEEAFEIQGPSPVQAGGGAPGVVNVNTAGVDELQTLPGIGPSLAQAIVVEREQGGPFASPEDLIRVSGIGDKKLARLLGSVTT